MLPWNSLDTTSWALSSISSQMIYSIFEPHFWTQPFTMSIFPSGHFILGDAHCSINRPWFMNHLPAPEPSSWVYTFIELFKKKFRGGFYFVGSMLFAQGFNCGCPWAMVSSCREDWMKRSPDIVIQYPILCSAILSLSHASLIPLDPLLLVWGWMGGWCGPYQQSDISEFLHGARSMPNISCS